MVLSFDAAQIAEVIDVLFFNFVCSITGIDKIPRLLAIDAINYLGNLLAGEFVEVSSIHTRFCPEILAELPRFF